MAEANKLYDHQIDALDRMHNGCILCGGTGSGKSRTALAYYFISQGGEFARTYKRMPGKPKDLYIITTARKRDTYEWDGELGPFLLSTDPDMNTYPNKVVVDSWNNIGKYKDVENAFFIFDEQRVVGYGTWAKTFIYIAKHNKWIMLSATPGDNWSDYTAVFIANGYFRNKTDFQKKHVIFNPRVSSFPKIDGYRDTQVLEHLRRDILVDMPFARPTTSHFEDLYSDYDRKKYNQVTRLRTNPFRHNLPIENVSELCQTWRRIVNSDPERLKLCVGLSVVHKKTIIFYNYDYELELLRKAYSENGIPYAEWNGHLHQEIPTGETWAYFVQYMAGAEGWNCIQTDTVIFYSQNYSYKMMKQAAGRIDRANTPFKHLYYYTLKSRAPIELAIGRALKEKKKFNESSYVKW